MTNAEAAEAFKKERRGLLYRISTAVHESRETLDAMNKRLEALDIAIGAIGKLEEVNGN